MFALAAGVTLVLGVLPAVLWPVVGVQFAVARSVEPPRRKKPEGNA